MRKIVFAVLLAVVGIFALEAQSARHTLFIGEFAGGSGRDGSRIAALLKAQDVLRNNFALVASQQQAEFIISGEITRDGIGYTTVFSISRGSGNALIQESIYYRGVMDITGYLPGIAENLARAAVPDLPATQTALITPPAAPVAAERIAVPTPASPGASGTPSQRQPTRPGARQPAAGTEEAPAADPFTFDTEPGDWLKKQFYVGAHLGFSSGFSIGAEADWRLNDSLGLRFGLGLRGFGSEWILNNNTTATKGTASSFSGYLAGTLSTPMNFSFGNMLLGAGAGLGFAAGGSDMTFGDTKYHYNRETSQYERRDGVGVSGVGFYLGAFADYQMGPGSIYTTLSYMWLMGFTDEGLANNNSGGETNYKLNGLSSVEFVIGYRIGFMDR